MRISVITPVLNKAKYIERCFASVACQAHANFEHIIIDGGSTDGTVELIDKYAFGRQNVTWISSPDGGQSHAINRGLRLAKGEVIGFINADDYYEPDVFATVTNIMQDMPRPAILFGNCNIRDDLAEITWVSKPVVLDIVEWLLPNGDKYIPVNPVQYFYTTDVHSIIGYYDEDEHYIMDADFLFRAVRIINTRYIDKLFGNFMLISGTKTLCDIEASTAEARFWQLRLKYIRSLSPLVRLIYKSKRIARQLA